MTFLLAAFLHLCPPGHTCIQEAPPFCLQDCSNHVRVLEANIDLLEDRLLISQKDLRGTKVDAARKRKGLIVGMSILASVSTSLLVAFVVEATAD